MNILITGGAGYIGSHTALELLKTEHTVVAVDNLCNSSAESLKRVEKISGKRVPLHVFDLRNSTKLNELFSQNQFDAVIHFAGLKAVGKSVNQPLEYYRNNIDSTLTLLETMLMHNVTKLVFSSSATVYGNPGTPIYSESLPTGQNISNPYGQTKYMIEQIIHDTCTANPEFQASLLRYFNPIGAHPSGEIGEDPLGIPNNLMPFITQVASGKRDKLSIFGNTYPTPDGTCLRDYIHVLDLACGHIAALKNLRPGLQTYNLGSGKPTSVLELVNTFIRVTGKDVARQFAPRRQGDLAEFYADPSKANKELGWHTEKSIDDMCRDAWNWQSKNPNGYRN